MKQSACRRKLSEIIGGCVNMVETTDTFRPFRCKAPTSVQAVLHLPTAADCSRAHRHSVRLSRRHAAITSQASLIDQTYLPILGPDAEPLHQAPARPAACTMTQQRENLRDASSIRTGTTLKRLPRTGGLTLASSRRPEPSAKPKLALHADIVSRTKMLATWQLQRRTADTRSIVARRWKCSLLISSAFSAGTTETAVRATREMNSCSQPQRRTSEGWQSSGLCTCACPSQHDCQLMT